MKESERGTDPRPTGRPAASAVAAPSQRLMQIGEVATRTELSLRTLRHWEDVGLLHPSGRSEGGFRLYTGADVDTILVIRRMKPLGFSLDEMKAVMTDVATLADASADRETLDAARARLEATVEDANARRENLVRHLAMADEFIDLLDNRLR